MPRPALCRLLLFLVFCGAAIGQETAPPADPRDARQQVLDHVRALAARIEDIHDESARARGFGQLGELVCKHDKEYARVLFGRAAESALSYQKLIRTKSSADAWRAEDGWNDLVQQMARCEPGLASQLKQRGVTEADRPRSPASASEMFRAVELGSLNAIPEAIEHANRALEARLTRSDLFMLFSVLYYIRATDPAAADALFLKAIKNLYSEVRADAWSLLEAGNYLFGPPMNGEGEVQDTMVDSVDIGGVRVPNIMGIRRWAKPELIRAYLEASLNILLRPTEDPVEKKFTFATAYQMRAKARTFAPDLAPLFESLMQKFSTQGSGTEQLESALAPLDRTLFLGLPKLLEEYEKAHDPVRRERLRILIIEELLPRGEFERVRGFAREMEDKAARDALLALVDFREALKLVEKGEFGLARQIASKFKDGFFRALFYAGLGAECSRRRDSEAALDAFLAAQSEAQSVETRLRARLLLMIAGPMASADATAAVAVLGQAVTVFNGLDRDPRTEDRSAPFPYGPSVHESYRVPTNPYIVGSHWGFVEYVRYGPGQDYFVLRAKGAEDYDFTPALLKKFASQAEQAEVTLAGLTDEWTRAGALASLAAAYLERIPPQGQ